MHSNTLQQPQELVAASDQAAGFLQSALDMAVYGLRHLDANPSFWQESIDNYATIKDKLIIESLLLVLVVRRWSDCPAQVQQSLQAICACCAPHVYTAQNWMLLSRYPHTAVTLGISHIALQEMGFGNARFGHLVQAAFHTRQVHAIDRLPYRAMEVRWLQSLVLPHQHIDFADLLSASLLNAPAHALRMSTADSYALTHALMYLTDFGEKETPIGVPTSQLEALIDQLIAVQIVNENLDVLGELLMALVFLRKPWSVRAQFAWQFLSQTWQQNGFLSSPGFDLAQYTACDTSAKAQAYAFKNTYHTLYVGAILCSLLLRRTAPFAKTGTDTNHRTLAAPAPYARLQSVMQAMDQCPSLHGIAHCQWTQVMQGSVMPADELSALLCDGLAVHATQHYDLITLCTLLENHIASQAEAAAQNHAPHCIAWPEMLREVLSLLTLQAQSGLLPLELITRIAHINALANTPILLGQGTGTPAINRSQVRDALPSLLPSS